MQVNDEWFQELVFTGVVVERTDARNCRGQISEIVGALGWDSTMGGV